MTNRFEKGWKLNFVFVCPAQGESLDQIRDFQSSLRVLYTVYGKGGRGYVTTDFAGDRWSGAGDVVEYAGQTTRAQKRPDSIGRRAKAISQRRKARQRIRPG